MSSDLSRRGFSGWFMEILVLNMEVLGSGTCLLLGPTSRISETESETESQRFGFQNLRHVWQL